MKPAVTFVHEFVDSFPVQLAERTLYVSMRFGSVAHKCACGCGNQVITPLSPSDWQLTYDGDTITLYPSIGNWNFPCQSHYWFRKNSIQWAPQWTKKQIEDGRAYDQWNKNRRQDTTPKPINGEYAPLPQKNKRRGWRTFLDRFRS
jgi:hypothetical protein